MYDKFLTVVIGPDNSETEYHIYKGVLCHNSTYFDRMLNGKFLEAGSSALRLQDVDVDAFHRFFYWLNTGSLDCTGGDAAISNHAL